MLRSSTRQRRVVESFVTAKREAQVRAFNDLLKVRSERNNKLKRGDIKQVIAKYHSKKLYCVTRYNLEYRLKLYDKGIPNLMSDNVPTTSTPVSTILSTSFVGADDISSLTFPHSNTPTNDSDNDLEELDYSIPATTGGRKIGTTLKAKKSKEQKLDLATSSVASQYIEIMKTAKSRGKQVKKNTLNNLITETSNEFGLTPASINYETIKSRIKASNPAGQAPQRTSPIADVEPLILHWIILLAEMGNPLTRSGIIELANEVIENT
jgi:hypothetical protein